VQLSAEAACHIVTYTIPTIRIEEYFSEGSSPFRRWFDGLDVQAAASVTVAIERLAEGNISNVKPIGEGAAELKINRGPGYRIYFGWDGKVLVILLGGGTKRRQQNDIDAALHRWRDYKKRKRSEG
jgi:putative addiction module killer protein